MTLALLDVGLGIKQGRHSRRMALGLPSLLLFDAWLFTHEIIPRECEGGSQAVWCPNCGDCICRTETDKNFGGTFDTVTFAHCPIHGRMLGNHVQGVDRLYAHPDDLKFSVAGHVIVGDAL